MDRREVQPLVHVPLVGRALAHGRQRHLAGLAQLRREGDADRMEHLGRDRRRERDEIVGHVPVVAGHLAPAGREVDRLGVLRGEDVAGLHAERQAGGDRAVEGRDPVLALLERPRDGRLRALVTLAADHERDPAGSVQDPHPLVDRPRGGDDAVHADEVVVGESDRSGELRHPGGAALRLRRRHQAPPLCGIEIRGIRS